jgi:polyisoprenoid-binding protein YceI
MAWEIDPAHSEAQFAVKHMMFTNVRGHFNVLSGSLNIDEQHPENSWVDAQVDASSVDTRNDHRDNHLRSADFFDVEKNPAITFKSNKVEHVKDNEYNVLGDLAMHGVTKPVLFKAEYAGRGKTPFGTVIAGLSAKTKISRKEWGLTYNQAIETGGVVVSDDVTIEIDLEAVQQA